MDVQIKRVTIENISALQQISKQTFAEAFSAGNSEENLKKYLEEGFAANKLIAELNNLNSEFYFAVLNQDVIGYLKVNFGGAQTEQQNKDAMEIERIYVLASFHGKKIGQLLYEYALQLARDNKCSYVWLGVWEENSRAIRFYQKNGFVAFDKHIFKLGNDEQTDIMMRFVL